MRSPKGQALRLIDRMTQPRLIVFWLAVVWLVVTQYEHPPALKRARAWQPQLSCYLLRLLQYPKSPPMSLSPSAAGIPLFLTFVLSVILPHKFYIMILVPFFFITPPTSSLLTFFSSTNSPLTPCYNPRLFLCPLPGEDRCSTCAGEICSCFLSAFHIHFFSVGCLCFFPLSSFIFLPY